MLAAGDTFRAAAIEQLQTWGQRIGVPVIANKPGSDPAAVVFDATSAAKARARRQPGLVATAGNGDGEATGMLRLRLPFRPPIDLDRMFGFLADRAIPGVEVASPDSYARTISLPNGFGILSLRTVPGASWVECSLMLSDLRDVTAAVQRCRRLLDLDADPSAISGFFLNDPLLGPLAASCPGRRAVGAVDGDEIAIRAVLGQQVSVAAARKLGARLVELCGTPLPGTVLSETKVADAVPPPTVTASVAGTGEQRTLSYSVGGLVPDESVSFYLDILGLPEVPLDDSDGARISGLAAGESLVELLEPERDESPIGKFIAKRGPGIHHVCFAVEDLEGILRAAY